MKTLDAWFTDYQVSHRDPRNKAIHFICVPAIMWSVVGLLFGIKLSAANPGLLNAATVVSVAAGMYYLALSLVLGSLMLGVLALMLSGCIAFERLQVLPLWQVSLAVFVVAWAGQFWGHKLEGKKPSFLQDLQFLLIGPLWVLGHITGKLASGHTKG